MKVLLISANTERINMPVLPLGLAYVAAAADSQGHTLKMLNLMMQTDTQKTVYGTIADFNPDIIGISVRNIDDQNMENPRFLLETVKEVVTNGTISSEIARQQEDGTWLWIIDYPTIGE